MLLSSFYDDMISIIGVIVITLKFGIFKQHDITLSLIISMIKDITLIE